MPRPAVVGRDPQLGQLLHRAEAHDARVADHLVAGLADPEAAALLRGHELDQRALALPVGVDLGSASPRLVRASARASRRDASQARSPRSNTARRSLGATLAEARARSSPGRVSVLALRGVLAGSRRARAGARAAPARRTRARTAAPRSSPPPSRSRRARPGHHRQVVGAGGEPGGEAAQAQAEHRGHRLVLAHVHEHAEGPVAERAQALAAPAWRPRCRPRPGPGGSRAGRSAGTAPCAAAPGPGTAAASPIAQTFSRPFTRMCASTSMRPSSVERQPELATTAAAASPRRSSRRVRVGIALAGGEHRGALVHAVEPRAGADLHAAAAQLARWRTRPGSAGISGMIRSSASTRIQRVPVEPAARVAVDHVGHVVLQLGDPLEPGVAGARRTRRSGTRAGSRRPAATRPSRGSRARGCAARSPRRAS